MPTAALTTRELIEQYIETLCSEPKTDALMDRFIADPHLKQHIREAEAAFPGYTLETHQLITEGDIAALRATIHGTHLGTFAGVPATGRVIKAPVMLFYRVADGRIAQFWMQLDIPTIMAQITG